jgi:hypothetical protein
MGVTDVRDRVPRPIEPGPEMRELRRFFPDVSWAGTIQEGGMGPGTPEMTAVGSGTHDLIQDGRWLVGTYRQDQYLRDGSYVLTWQLLWVVGWVPEAAAYRAMMADNYGHVNVFDGRIDGDRLVFESTGNAPARLRFTWDASDPGDIAWRNEMAVGDEAWFLIEEYRMTPKVA